VKVGCLYKLQLLRLGRMRGIAVDLSLPLVGGAIMSFKSVWGFVPEGPFQAQLRFRSELGIQESGYNFVEDHFARIPPDVGSQIHELRRLFHA
jgi:hypothetical protein